MLKRENVLRKGGVPEEGGNMKKCNDVGDAVVGPPTMNIDQYPPRHIHTTSVTAMMIQWATMNMEHQGINLKPYKNFISKKYRLL